MDLKRVKALLDEYYEGRTSREEEIFLLNFFRGQNIPVEMKADKLLFLSMYESSKDEIPNEKFEEKLFAAIDESDHEKKKKGIVRKLLLAATALAASVLLFMGGYLFLANRQTGDPFLVSDEYSTDDTRHAYEEARSALLLVSGVMNKGTEQLGALSKMSDATQELNMLNKFYQGAVELQAISRFDNTVSDIRQENNEN